MLNLLDKKFCSLMCPALIIIIGVMLKNGGKQFNEHKGVKEDKMVMLLGTILFIGGWIGVAYAAATTDTGFKSGQNLWLPIMSSTAIVLSVMGMMQAKQKYGEDTPEWFNVLVFVFAIGWLVLGYSVAMGKGDKTMVLGIGAAVFVLVSMLIALPWQRKNNVVDGPGMALFALGWVLLAAANSA